MSRAPDATLCHFLADAVGVLRDAVGIEATIDPAPGVREPGDDIAVLIQARGDLSGVSYRFPLAVARHAAERMAPGLASTSETWAAAASELANVLTGRGLSMLERRGLHAEIDPPEIAALVPSLARANLMTPLGAIEVGFHYRSRT